MLSYKVIVATYGSTRNFTVRRWIQISACPTKVANMCITSLISFECCSHTEHRLTGEACEYGFDDDDHTCLVARRYKATLKIIAQGSYCTECYNDEVDTIFGKYYRQYGDKYIADIRAFEPYTEIKQSLAEIEDKMQEELDSWKAQCFRSGGGPGEASKCLRASMQQNIQNVEDADKVEHVLNWSNKRPKLQVEGTSSTMRHRGRGKSFVDRILRTFSKSAT